MSERNEEIDEFVEEEYYPDSVLDIALWLTLSEFKQQIEGDAVTDKTGSFYEAVSRNDIGFQRHIPFELCDLDALLLTTTHVAIYEG